MTFKREELGGRKKVNGLLAVWHMISYIHVTYIIYIQYVYIYINMIYIYMIHRRRHICLEVYYSLDNTRCNCELLECFNAKAASSNSAISRLKYLSGPLLLSMGVLFHY